MVSAGGGGLLVKGPQTWKRPACLFPSQDVTVSTGHLELQQPSGNQREEMSHLLWDRAKDTGSQQSPGVTLIHDARADGETLCSPTLLTPLHLQFSLPCS